MITIQNTWNMLLFFLGEYALSYFWKKLFRQKLRKYHPQNIGPTKIITFTSNPTVSEIELLDFHSKKPAKQE